MSMYKHLSIPVPVIAYCAMHQALPTIATGEYEKTMRELHDRIADETALIAHGYKAFLHESINHEVDDLRSTLSQFLEAPLSRDNAEIRGMFNESLTKFSDQIRGTRQVGLKHATEGRFVFPELNNSTGESLLQRGREYLKQLGFESGEGAGSVYESEFVVDGGENLDILEHIVRDKLGIYARTHGKHIKEFAGYSYTAFNLAYQRGERASKSAPAGQLEAALFFSKPDVKYAPFRNGLAAVFDQISVDLNIPHITLWQRKLGLGSGDEFVVRMKFESTDRINEMIEWLWAKTEKAFVHEALVAHGKLTIKQILF